MREVYKAAFPFYFDIQRNMESSLEEAQLGAFTNPGEERAYISFQVTPRM
jgi:hypothetical protein